MPGVKWLCGVLAFASCAAGGWGQSPDVQVVRASGTLRGYFLRPSGRLRARGLELSSDEPSGRLRELHPLWSGYYLRVTVESPGAAISAARLEAIPSGKELLTLTPDEPQHVLRFAPREDGWLRAHPEDGLTFRVNATLEDGRTISLPLYPQGVRLLDIPEPKIDWLDLVRIAEVRRLLRAKGDEILPGLQADDVPFALVGGDGQCLLLDHPRPPEGFHRYIGPLPAPFRVHIGQYQDSPPSLASMEQVGGVLTVVVGYRPWWWALPQSGGTARDPDEASTRLSALIHEICHVAWSRRTSRTSVGFDPRLMGTPGARPWVLERLERAVLEEALDEEDASRLSLIRDYLALRETRRRVSRRAQAITAAEELLETTEGFAYHGQWRATPRLASLAVSGPLAEIDPFFEGLFEDDPLDWAWDAVEERTALMTWSVGEWVAALAWLHGIYQARLLDELDGAMLRRAWRDGLTLHEALARASGYAALTEDERARLRAQACRRWGYAERVAETRRRLREGGSLLRERLRQARTGKSVTLRVRARLSRQRMAPHERLGKPQFAETLFCGGDGFTAFIAGPCLVRHLYTGRTTVLDVRTVLDPEGDVLWLCRRGDGLALRTEEVMIAATNATLQRRGRRLLLCARPGKRSARKSPEEESEPEVRMGKWIAVPMAMLALQGKAGAELPHHQITLTLTGAFRNADTGCIIETTLDLIAEDEEPSANWEMLEGEAYSLSFTAEDPQYSRVARVAAYAGDELIDEATADPPAATLSIIKTIIGWFTGPWQIKPKAKHDGHCKWSFEFVLEPKPPSPQQSATIQVTVVDGKTREGLGGAYVEIWPENQPDHKQGDYTSPDGRREFSGLAFGRWMIEVRDPALESCRLRKGPFRLRKRHRLEEEGFVLWPHYGIEGKIWFKTPDGQPADGDASQVQIDLLQGGNPVQSGTVEETPNEDGSYDYTIGPPPPAGSYTVRAKYNPTGETHESGVTVPDDCATTHPDIDGGNLVSLAPGAHQKVDGSTFTFTVEGMGGGEPPGADPPPEGGGDPPPEGGGEDPPPEGGGDPSPGP